MAYFGDVARRLQPGYIAKTPTMKGYVRRHTVAYRTESGEGYDYYDKDGVKQTEASGIAAVQALLVLPEGDRDRGSPATEFDCVFDLELVENPSWSSAGSGAGVDQDALGGALQAYPFRCWQEGGTERTYGDRRLWRVCTYVDGTGWVPRALYDGQAMQYSSLKLDSATADAFLFSPDWTCNDTLESDYAASVSSTSRW